MRTLALALLLTLTACSAPAVRYSPGPKPVPILHQPGDASAAGLVTPRIGFHDAPEPFTVALEGQGHMAIALPYHVALMVTANGSVVPERKPDYAHYRVGVGVGAYDLIPGPWAADVFAGIEMGRHSGNAQLSNGVEVVGNSWIIPVIVARPLINATYTAHSHTRFALVNLSYDYADRFRQTLSLRLSSEHFHGVDTDTPRLDNGDARILLLEPQLSSFVPVGPSWGLVLSAGASVALFGKQPVGYRQRTYYGAIGYQWQLNR